jgi:uncharacterized protein DUF6790
MPDFSQWSDAQIGDLIVSMVPIVMWGAALLCAGIAIWRGPRPATWGFVFDKLLRYLFIFPLGVQALWAFLSHVLLPEESAAAIGWAPSPFQYEVGVANLGIALGSFYAAFGTFQARAAMAIAAGAFLAGAGIGHIVEIVEDLNYAPGNAGPIMISDFLTPIVVLVLLLLSPSQSPSGPLVSEQLARAREDLRKSLHAPEGAS